MKVKELIAELEQFDPEAEAYVAVYDCGGFNDVQSVEDVEQLSPDSGVQMHIYVGCDTHRKWTTQQHCPVEKLQETIKKCDELKSTVNYYQEQMVFLEKRFAERNRKDGNNPT